MGKIINKLKIVINLRDVFFGVGGLVIGGIISLIISNHFYAKSIEEQRKGLIDNAIFEIDLNCSELVYPYYQDTINFREAGRPFPYLRVLSIERLYSNIQTFDLENDSLKDTFINLVLDCQFQVNFFNDFIRKRNDQFYINAEHVKQYNSTAFELYQVYVLRAVEKLRNFVDKNQQLLTK